MHDAQVSAVQSVRIAGARVRPAVVSNPAAIDALDHSVGVFFRRQQQQDGRKEREREKTIIDESSGGRGIPPVQDGWGCNHNTSSVTTVSLPRAFV